MTGALTDDLGTPVAVAVERADPISAYVIRLDNDSAVGRAEFIDPPGDAPERIFFHTEVDPDFGGRGLARLLVRAALDDSIRDGIDVVPVCPLFARHLDQHGTEFLAAGGQFRSPVRADIVLVGRIRGGRS